MRFIIGLLISTVLGFVCGQIVPWPLIGAAVGGGTGGYIIRHFFAVRDAKKTKDALQKAGVDHIEGGKAQKSSFSVVFVIVVLIVLTLLVLFIIKGGDINFSDFSFSDF